MNMVTKARTLAPIAHGVRGSPASIKTQRRHGSAIAMTDKGVGDCNGDNGAKK